MLVILSIPHSSIREQSNGWGPVALRRFAAPLAEKFASTLPAGAIMPSVIAKTRKKYADLIRRCLLADIALFSFVYWEGQFIATVFNIVSHGCLCNRTKTCVISNLIFWAECRMTHVYSSRRAKGWPEASLGACGR